MDKVAHQLNEKFTKIWLLVLIIIATYIRISGVWEYSYNEDEAIIINAASGKSLAQVLRFSFYEPHPSLNYIILHYWLIIAHEIWFARGLALLFGVALIPLYYKIGKKLNGELTGICAAFLVAFSTALITQSYIVRNYTILVFFLSILFYYYLKWKDAEQRNKSLILYFIFAVLACLTHFSAILTIFTIASCETIRLFLQKANKVALVKWVVINLLIAVIFLAIYYIWQPLLDTQKTIVHNDYSSNLDNIVSGIFYTLVVSGYVSFGIYFSIAVFAFIPIMVKNNKHFLAYFIMSAVSLIIGSILFATGYYGQGGLRHSLWVVPFIAPIFALVINEFYKMLLSKYIRQRIFAFIIIAVGIIIYSSSERFSSLDEYTITQKDWQEIQFYLSRLDNKTLIVAEANDAAILGNTYEYFSVDDKKPVIMPYHNTSVIFFPFYLGYIEKASFINYMSLMKNNDSIKNSDNLVFMRTIWTGGNDAFAPIPLLFLCQELDRKIFAFPPLKPNETITAKNAHNFTALFMTISKKDFFEQVVSPTGKANSCLDRK